MIRIEIIKMTNKDRFFFVSLKNINFLKQIKLFAVFIVKLLEIESSS